MHGRECGVFGEQQARDCVAPTDLYRGGVDGAKSEYVAINNLESVTSESRISASVLIFPPVIGAVGKSRAWDCQTPM
jgi:hypothetical protein